MFEGSCSHPGANYWGDIGYLEVLDPDTGQKVGDPVGRGELVATNLAEFFLEKRAENHDKLYLSIAYDPEMTQDAEELRQRLQSRFQEELQVASEINWVSSDAIPRPVPHKLQKFVDKTK
ncbi:MAG: hypothetical protein IMW91_10830 [Firmicutes bacterium]|nr:hypothetical protein [Bacillota bacterium]